MLLHAEAREFVILGVALAIPGAINQLDDVIDFAIRSGAQGFRF
jgi:hypothetical protein